MYIIITMCVSCSKHQTHYEQWGELKGTLSIEGHSTQQLRLKAVRDHTFGELLSSHGTSEIECQQTIVFSPLSLVCVFCCCCFQCCQAHQCGVFIQKHPSIITIYLLLIHLSSCDSFFFH